MGRIIAIDYGRKRVGLAVTDTLRICANPLDTVPAHECLAYLTKYISQNDVDIIVVGEPRQMNGEPSESQRYITPFVQRLRALMPDMTIDFQDERFTSVLAKRAMIEAGVPKMKRRDKGLTDRTSAVIILQSYLERDDITNLR